VALASQEAAVRGESDLDQIVSLVERRRIRCLIAVLEVHVAPAAVIGPAVILAHMIFAVAGRPVADERAAMPAAVDETMQFAFGVAADHHGVAADERGHVVVRRRHLRFQPEEHPRGLEDMPHLPVEDLRVAEDIAVHAKFPALRIVDNQPVQACKCVQHFPLSGFAAQDGGSAKNRSPGAGPVADRSKANAMPDSRV
jgi:hypothetical protein